MATLVIKTQGAITNPTGFPYLSKFGLVNQKEIGEYFERMDDAGHEWTQGEINAFKTFSQSLVDADVWDSIIEMYPLYGDNTTAAVLPIFARLTNNAPLTGDVSDPSIVSDKIVGFGPGTTGLFSELTLEDMHVKSGLFENENAINIGHLLYHNLSTLGGEFRFGIFAQRTGPADYFHAFRVLSAPWEAININLFRGSVTAASPAAVNDYWHITSGDGTAYNRYLGSLSAATYTDSTVSAKSYTTSDPFFPELLKLAINCQAQYNASGALTGRSGINANHDLRFYATDDGSINSQIKKDALRTAIGALSTAIGKNF
jgi:hypothetical protein